MKQIELNNPQLRSILNDFLIVFQEKFDFKTFPHFRNPDQQFTLEYVTGNEYLSHMQGKKVTGYPEQTYGFDLMFERGNQNIINDNPPLKKALVKLDKDLLAWSGSRNNAVKMVYPKGGFMGWHHNANAPGYNILISWSKDGTGFFKYQDPITKEIITINDSPGWTCKVGYYGALHEKDKIYWHCAGAPFEERFTLGYIIPHQGMWESMIEDIESM